jgi:hypothetical protein
MSSSDTRPWVGVGVSVVLGKIEATPPLTSLRNDLFRLAAHFALRHDLLPEDVSGRDERDVILLDQATGGFVRRTW